MNNTLRKSLNNRNVFLTTPAAKFKLYFKSAFRTLFGWTFKYRYLNSSKMISGYGPVFKYSFDKYKNSSNPLFFEESRMIDLFETSEKVKYLSATLINVDSSELIVLDSFRENYPYTVYHK